MRSQTEYNLILKKQLDVILRIKKRNDKFV